MRRLSLLIVAVGSVLALLGWGVVFTYDRHQTGTAEQRLTHALCEDALIRRRATEQEFTRFVTIQDNISHPLSTMDGARERAEQVLRQDETLTFSLVSQVLYEEEWDRLQKIYADANNQIRVFCLRVSTEPKISVSDILGR